MSRGTSMPLSRAMHQPVAGPALSSVLLTLLVLPSALDSLRATYAVPFVGLLSVTACLILWLTASFSHGRISFRSTATHGLLLLMAATVILSSTSPVGDPLSKLYRALSFCYTKLLPVFLVVNVVRGTQAVRRAMYAVIVIAALSAIVAIWQFWAFQATGANLNPIEEDMFRFTATATYLRATGLSSHPNLIGRIMAVAGVWTISLGLRGSGFAQVGHYLLFLLLAAGVAVTFSRSSLLALVLGAITVAVAQLIMDTADRSRLWAPLALIAAVTPVGAILLPEFFHEETDDVLWRLELNQFGLRVALENPITGVGVDEFAASNPYSLPVHNLFINVASETGIATLLVFIALTTTVLTQLLLCVSRTRHDRARSSLALPATAGYAAELLAHLSEPVLADLFFWVVLGLSQAAVHEDETESPARGHPNAR